MPRACPRDFAPFSIQIVGECAEPEGKTDTSRARKVRDRPGQKPNPRILEIITKLFPAVFHIQLKGVHVEWGMKATLGCSCRRR